MAISAKRIRLSDDSGSNWYTLPGNSGEFQNEGQVLDDTIFGQLYQSGFPGLINWTASSTAIYKGFAGYECVISAQSGAATAFTTEAMTEITANEEYQITDTTKRIWDYATTLSVFDNGSPVAAADIESIDYLFGIVHFVSGYTAAGAITVTGAYFAVTQIAGTRSFTLTMQGEAIDETTLPIAQGNSGHRIFSLGLKTVSMEASGVYALSNGFRAALVARSELIVEVKPVGTAETIFRGYFRYTQQGQSGDVGALEEETITLTLSVPNVDNMTTPFSVGYTSTSLSNAVQIAIAAWLNATEIDVQYLPDGTTGLTGSCIITDVSLEGGLESMNIFSCGIQGTGQVSAVP